MHQHMNMANQPFLSFICLIVSALCSIPALIQLSRQSLGTRNPNVYSNELLYQDEDGVSKDQARKRGAAKLRQVLIVVCSIAGLLLSGAVFIEIAHREGHGNFRESSFICGIWV